MPKLRLFTMRHIAIFTVIIVAAIASIAIVGHGAKASSSSSNLLQFTAGSHIVGFADDGVVVVAPTHALKVNFANSNKVTPTSDTPTTSDTKAAPLTKVTYTNVWNGIDVVYEAEKDSVMKSTYYVDITKDNVLPSDIKLQYNRPVSLDAYGNLVISYDTGTMTESAPVAWQVIEGENVPIDVSFAIKGDREVGFTVANFTPNIPIVIDPTYAWNSFLGGGGSDESYGIAIDESGNVYIAGLSDATWGSPVRAKAAGTDAFAAKLDSSGTLTWNTFLGGGGSDSATGITVDGSGSVYINGTSNVTWGSPVRAYVLGGDDGFAAKLSSSGTLTWNTFLGGGGSDSATGITVDGSGSVYITGTSDATWGSPVQAKAASNDGFAAKLDSSGTLTWNTFLGGGGTDNASGIAVDSSGSVYIAGTASATWGSPVRAYTSGTDAFAAKLDSSGTLTWNTFLGGGGTDGANWITIDTDGNIYLSGTASATWGSPVRAYTSSFDVFAAKLSSSGTLTWNTFLGGSGSDGTEGLAIDSVGNVYIAGQSNATWGSPVRAYTLGDDGFAAKLSSSGTLTWNTFLGASGYNTAYEVAVDGSGSVYITGTSDATWGSPTQAYSSDYDAFAAKLSSSGHLSAFGIISSAGSGGSITPSGTTVVGSGLSQSYTITPDSGYAIQDILVDGVSVGAVASYDFTSVTADHTISATFSLIPVATPAPAPGSQTAISMPIVPYTELVKIFGDRAIRTPENSRMSSISVTPPSVGNITLPLITVRATQGMRSSEILIVQRILNSDPTTRIAQIGPGSPGKETSLYGPATRVAVQKFQLKYGIVKSVRDSGYGIVGPKTRMRMNELIVKGI